MRTRLISIFLIVNFVTTFAQWNDLRVTWPFPKKLPKTESQAQTQGWSKEKSCGQVNGNRYLFQNDSSVLLIFNSVGQISGLATRLPKGLPFNYPSTKIQKYFTDEGNFYVLTVYFRDPDTICSTTAISDQVIGDRFVIRGTNFELNAPLQQSSLSNTFTKGGCFPTQGLHFWSDVDGLPVNENTNAANLTPLLLLYNKGKLNEFSLVFNAVLNGKYYVHPPKILSNIVFKSPPKYLSDPNQSAGLTSLLVSLDNNFFSNCC